MLGDMPPAFASSDAPSRDLGYPESCGEFSPSCAFTPEDSQLAHGVGGQLGTPLLLTVGESFGMEMRRVGVSGWRASPHAPVAHVVGGRARIQVLRPDAGRIVAMMQDAQSDRDRAVVEFPRETVGTDGVSTNPELPVAESVPAALPFPTAFVGTVHLRPEPFGGRQRGTLGTHLGLTSVVPRPRRCQPRGGTRMSLIVSHCCERMV